MSAWRMAAVEQAARERERRERLAAEWERLVARTERMRALGVVYCDCSPDDDCTHEDE